MGNDGGSIPTRRELVKEVARNPTTSELKETQKEHLAHRWSTCALSHKPLRRPVVSDSTGLLYNKDAVLQYLLPANTSALDKQDCDQTLQGRIKSLKDIVEVLFEVDADQASDRERWTCPVTSKELGPSVKAVYLVPCGHAFSQEAIKEMKTERCLQCNQSYDPGDTVTLFPVTAAEKSIMQNRIDSLTEKGLTHSRKKASASSKKRNASKMATKEQRHATEARPQDADTPPIPRSTTSLSGTSIPNASDGIQNASTASLTAKVLGEETERKKRRLVSGESENLRSLFTKKDDKRKLHDGSFLTRGFSIPASARHE